MIREDKGRIVQGQVFYRNQWMPIERKVQLEARNRKKIEEGYVLFQGEWITIEEKRARVTPQKPTVKGPEKVVYNKTINRQTYTVHHNENIDNRVIHEHDHRHVHVNGQTLSNLTREEQERIRQSQGAAPLRYGEEAHGLEDQRQQKKMLPHDKKYPRSLEDKHTKKGFDITEESDE